eukprot:m.109680 g.109680  ORF g.109680 m.109680 type:complete len:218 (+) comp51778_c0_seq3:386-1039(+)
MSLVAFGKDQTVAQDRVAASTVQCISGLIVGVLGTLVPGALCVLFVSEAVALLAAAYCTHHSPRLAPHYFDSSSPRMGKVGLVSVGVGVCGRWALAAALLPANQTLFHALNAAAVVLYFAYILLVNRPRIRRAMTVVFLSSLMLFCALVFRHSKRNRNFHHTRDEPRIAIGAFAHLVYCLLIFPGRLYVTVWLLELLALFSWMLLFACSGHEFFLNL